MSHAYTEDQLVEQPAIGLFAELKARVRAAQVKAALSVNRELIALYWDIGRVILQRQRAEAWGAKVVARLAADLRAEFPEMTGFSRPNLLFMRAFAAAWSERPIVLQLVRLLPEAAQNLQPSAGDKSPAGVRESSGAVLQQPVAQFPASPPEPMASLPWGHNLVLLTKLKKPVERLWYAQAALRHGWNRAVLTVQIETQAHRRMGKALTNFARTLPPPQSDLAQQVLKDSYTFDFLTLSAEARERELEQGLTEHIQKLLVELGVGFAFVGRQVHVEVGGEDYYLDLLFYHLKLRCFVVLDLKMEAFKPEFAGNPSRMNPAAAISGICPVSTGGEMAAFTETALLARPGILFERPPACRCKYRISNEFLFE